MRQEKVKARTLRRLRKQAAAHASEVDKLLTRWRKRRRLLERADELGLPRRPGADEELSDEWEEDLADAVVDDVPPTASKDRMGHRNARISCAACGVVLTWAIVAVFLTSCVPAATSRRWLADDGAPLFPGGLVRRRPPASELLDRPIDVQDDGAEAGPSVDTPASRQRCAPASQRAARWRGPRF